MNVFPRPQTIVVQSTSKMARSSVLLAFSCFIFNVVTADLTFVDPQNVNDRRLVVTLPDGQIYGRRDTTVDKGDEYLSFRGIPFAQPPLGELRFKPPRKNDKWTGILNCTEDRSECIQQFTPIEGSEDCLYINVYTPDISGNLSVMVFIYGGSFFAGNSSYHAYGPDFLLEKNVVYVSFNYRLGILGFLNTGDLAAPGNWGLKDQVLALQWIQENIRLFGGNPKSVTIFGQSAGGASVSYMLQIDQTKDLFHAAIMESGVSLNTFALSRAGVEAAYQTAANLSIDTSNTIAMVEALRKVNVNDLYAATVPIYDALSADDVLAGLMFAPVVEPVHDGAALTTKSYARLSRGRFHRVPCLMGFNSDEAAAAPTPLAPIADVVAFTRQMFEVNSEANNLTPADMTTNVFKRFLVGNIIKYNYAGALKPSSVVPDPVINQFLQDDQFVRPTREAALQQSKYVPVYLYEFGYVGILGSQQNRTFPGVGHLEELGYLFIIGTDDVDPNLVTPADKLTRARMVTMWTNMAKFGNPTPVADPLLQNVRWPLAGTDRSKVRLLNITANLVPSANPSREKMAFYDVLYDLYGDRNYDTY